MTSASHRINEFTHSALARWHREATLWSNKAAHKDLKTDVLPSERLNRLEVIRESSKLGRFMEGKLMQNFLMFLVILNAVQMGFEANLYEEPWDRIWTVSERFFVTIFFLEMVLKLRVEKCHYFSDYWNLLDFVVVWISIVGIFIVLESDSDNKFAVARIFRLLRIFRLGKVVHQIPELYSILSGLVNSMKAVAWSLIVLTLLLYLFGICAVELIGKDEKMFPGYSKDISALETVAGVEEYNNFFYFGTLERAMISLVGFLLLAEWENVVRPIWEREPWMLLLFSVLIALTTLGVMNIIIGIICEQTRNTMNEQKKIKEEREKHTKSVLVEELATIFCTLDVDDDSKVTWEDCRDASSEKVDRIASFIESIKFPPGSSFSEIFKMLDVNGDGVLSKREFVRGLYRIVNCDDFQRNCILVAHIGQLISMQTSLKHELQSDLHRIREDILNAVVQGRPVALRQTHDTGIGRPTGDCPESTQSRHSHRGHSGLQGREYIDNSRSVAVKEVDMSIPVLPAMDAILQKELVGITDRIQLALDDLMGFVQGSTRVANPPKDKDCAPNATSVSDSHFSDRVSSGKHCELLVSSRHGQERTLPYQVGEEENGSLPKGGGLRFEPTKKIVTYL